MEVIHRCEDCGEQLPARPASARWCATCRQERCRRTCQKCGQDFWVQKPTHQTSHHRACFLELLRQGAGYKPERSGTRTRCAHCGAPVYRTPGLAARHKNAFCSRACYVAWLRAGHSPLTGRCKPRVAVRCVACGEERSYRQHRVPQAVDPARLTWTCLRCRAATVQERVCSYCHAPFKRSFAHGDQRTEVFCCREHWHLWAREHADVVTVRCEYCWLLESRSATPNYRNAMFSRPRSQHRAGPRHFCCRRHTILYYHAQRRAAVPCRQCGTLFQRRQRGGIFCSAACYAQWRKNRPAPNLRVSDAEQRILAAWQRGVRGVRALAREVGASPNTVRKALAKGALVEPAEAPVAVA